MAGFSELNLKIPAILAISIFMNILNLMRSRVEHEKSFITSAPGLGRYNVLGYLKIHLVSNNTTDSLKQMEIIIWAPMDQTTDNKYLTPTN